MEEPAGRLRQDMTMPLNWIAKPLNMGAAGFLANLLREARRNENMHYAGLTRLGSPDLYEFGLSGCWDLTTYWR
jgi:hypothetical protein